jgi:hypothetical protein
MGCDVISLLGQAKKIETDLGKIRAVLVRMVFEALMEK